MMCCKGRPMACCVRTTMLGMLMAVLGCDFLSSGDDTAKTETVPQTQAEKDTGNEETGESGNKRELLPARERFTTEEFSVLVPDGWNNDARLATGMKKLFIVGDGKGVPLLDDTGSPLQLGMAVEHYPDEESIEDRIKILTEDARIAPQRTLGSEPAIEHVQLPDGTKASLVIVEMIKQEFRKSLYMKLLVQDQTGTTWVTTGWIVASRESKLARKDSKLANRMQSLIQSFAFAKKSEL